MSCPLFKKMKNKGTSFFAFPSSASDLNLANYNDFYDLNFTKFVLINIPRQEPSANQERPIDGVMDFIPKRNDGNAPFYSDDPNYTTPTKLSDQLVESLRNYVANYDTTCHESRINSNTDFYNISERYTPTEQIFWKWCRKLNMIDFEPAVHKVDWDKNLSDFDNPNASTINNVDYFKKYLWKEREVIDYKIVNFYEDSTYQYEGNNTVQLEITEITKFKIGDKIILKSNTSSDESKLSNGTDPIVFGEIYTIGKITFSGTTSYINLDVRFQGGGNSTIGNTLQTTYIYLHYNRLIQYIGEINQITNIQTASRIGQEVTAYIPHQGGRTPSVLFGIRSNTNYYPNLELPILADEIQRFIIGAESLNSPIRTNPTNYPGSFYGQFDTENNTYLCSNGDNIRYQGDYYGIKLTDNTGLSADDYIEKLTDFNSDNIDGVFLDVDRNHYYKTNIPNLETKNFDEFSSISINGQAPEDFDFNAILWYYELIERDQDNNVHSYVNLYGIEFLNNPDNDDDNDGTLITPYHKLVTNGEHDGLSYMFNLNLHYNIDNDIQPLTYDPSTIYNMFGFDMYNEMMRRFYQVNENFVNIISEFVRMNQDMQDMKSLIYTQTSIDELKLKMKNIENLLNVYKTNQFVDSDTAKISVDNSGIYPKLKFNVISVDYDEIKNVSLTEAYNYNYTNTGASYPVAISFTANMLLNLVNDNHTNSDENSSVVVLLDRDLKNKQKLDIIIKPDHANFGQKLYLNMMFNNNNTLEERNIFSVDLPKDLKWYNSSNPDDTTTFLDSYYLNENIYVNCTDVFTGVTCCSGNTNIELVLTEDIFKSGNTVYVQNLYFRMSDNSVKDFSGSYSVINKIGIHLTINLPVNNDNPELNLCGSTLVGQPRISFYRGIQATILRVNADNTSTFAERYNVSYKII